MLLIFLLHRLLRYIRRSHQATAEQLYYHSLLSGYASHSALYAFEITFCYDDMVSQFVLDVLRHDGYDVRVLYGCQLDEVVHGVIADDERRIAVGIVLTGRVVVVVISQQRTRLYEFTFLSWSIASTSSCDEWTKMKDGIRGSVIICFLPCFVICL